MKLRIGAGLTLLSLLFTAAGFSAGEAATPRSAVSEDVVSKEVEILEHRFFPKAYSNDPLDKRLQRLELMIYGATQGGSLPERLDRLKKDVAIRSKTSPVGAAKAIPGMSDKSGGAPGAGAGAAGGSAQYPVLSTLEWRALKKTFVNESLDQRLARLESQLFGQPSTTMPYVDRIDRLKKVMGLGMTSEVPSRGGGSLGPAPRARPRGSNPYGGAPSWVTPSPFAFGDMPGLDGEMFGGNEDVARSMAEMMRTMRQHMSELQRLGPGSWVYDPQTGTFVEQGTGRRFRGNNLPVIPPRRTTPGTKDDAQIPPYLDPNSI